MGFRLQISLATIIAAFLMGLVYGCQHHHNTKAGAALATHERVQDADVSEGNVDDDRRFLDDFVQSQD